MTYRRAMRRRGELLQAERSRPLTDEERRELAIYDEMVDQRSRETYGAMRDVLRTIAERFRPLS